MSDVKNAFTECSCGPIRSPDARVFTVTALNPIPSAASMTLRDYFAGQALPSIVDHYHLPHSAAKLAYEYADAMLKAREEKP